MASGQFRCANDDNWRVRRASAGRGLGSGSGVTHAETVVDASDTLTLISGRDTTLQGAQAFGEQVLANVGRDLSIVSEQDLDGYSSQQQQAGGTFVYGAGGSVSYGRERIDSRYRGVVEQSGIQAGEGGFDITVGGHTHLEGGAIASVADPSRNRLSTGSLTVESLQNDAAYRADSGGVSTGSWKDAGISAGASLAVGQREGADGLTRAGISDGTLEIRDGGTSALADLDRGVTELQGEAFAAIFDPQKVAERLEMGQVAGEVGFRAAGDLASSMGWPEGSKERTLLHGAVGAAMAALGGGDALEGLTGAVANQLVFNAVRGFLTDNAELAEGTAEFNALVQLASLAVGAVVGGQTGAATALSATKHNYLTHQDIELVEKALSACGGDDTCRQEVLEVARDISESKDYLVWSTCAENATSSDCQQHVQGASDYRYAVGLDALGLAEDRTRSVSSLMNFINYSEAGGLYRGYVLEGGGIRPIHVLPAEHMVDALGQWSNSLSSSLGRNGLFSWETGAILAQGLTETASAKVRSVLSVSGRNEGFGYGATKDGTVPTLPNSQEGFGRVTPNNASEANFIANANETFKNSSTWTGVVRHRNELVIQRSDIEPSRENMERMSRGLAPFVRNERGGWEPVQLHHIGRETGKMIEVTRSQNRYDQVSGGVLHIPGPGGPVRQADYSRSYWKQRYDEIIRSGN